MPTLHILEVLSGMEAQAIRAAAEYWDYDVTITWTGNSQNVVDAFQRTPPSDIMMMAAHGDDDGLVLPDLHPDIRDNYPYAERISATDFSEFAKPVAKVLLTTACSLGVAAYVDAFHRCGFESYVAPVDDPRSTDALMYALSFLYEYARNGRDPVGAHQAAVGPDDRSMFRVFPRV